MVKKMPLFGNKKEKITFGMRKDGQPYPKIVNRRLTGLEQKINANQKWFESLSFEQKIKEARKRGMTVSELRNAVFTGSRLLR